MGEKTAGKAKKDLFDKHSIIVAGYFRRQSEKTIPRRSVKFRFTDGSRVSAKEKVGNAIIFLCCFFMLDLKKLVDIDFEKCKE